MWIDIVLIIVGLIGLVLLGALGLYLLRRSVETRRSLEKIHLRVLIPRKDSDADQKNETVHDTKQQVSIMEQLLSAMNSVYSKKILDRILGQETFSLEYFAHKNQIFFHVVISVGLRVLIEKQITSFYPDAVIDVVPEPNIFAQDGTCFVNTTLYLEEDYVYPIKTYQKLESDPINNVVNALSKLEENESCVVQILLKPIKNSWQKEASKKASQLQKWGHHFSWNPFHWIGSAISALFKSEKNDKQESKDSSALESSTVQLIDEKGKKVGFESIIRIITTGPDEHTCELQIKNIVSAFEQFSSPETNGFHETNYHSRSVINRNYIYRTFSRIGSNSLRKMILNTEELASMFHFPHSKYNLTPEIKWQDFKIVKAPENIPTEGLLLGFNIFRGQKRPIYMKNEDRMRHAYIIGQTGTGKSTMLTQMAKQDVRAGRGVCVMDPHGDLASDVITFIPRERADDVIYFNPGDLERPMGINLLEAESPDEKEAVAQEANKMMIKLYGNEVFGPRIQDYFLNAVLTLMDYPGGGTLCDVMPMVANPSFQQERRNTLRNKVVKAWWENMYDSQGDREKKEILPYFQAKFSPFSTNSMMRNIIGQVKSSFQISDAMNTKKILLLNLSKGLLGDLNSNLLGMMFVSKIQVAAMRRQKIEKENRVDFFFYIDEFQNFVTDSIESILSEARKYRLSLNLAHQYLGQLEKSDALTKSNVNLKDAVFGNVGTKMSYKVGAIDAEYLQKEFAPSFSDFDLVNMDKFKAVMKLSVDNQPSKPFSIVPINPFEGETKDTKLMKAFIELSRLKYGREREFVEKEILFRIGT